MAFFFVTVFRSFSDKDELDSEERNKNELNTWHGSKSDANKCADHLPGSNMKPLFDENELNAAKLKQAKINKCHKILREIAFNAIFIWVLIVIAYTNRNTNSFNYQNNIKSEFSSFRQVKNIFSKLFNS